eukprot:SAG11_NODE_2218_length_3676_cov_3.617557_1_plen_26_part_10
MAQPTHLTSRKASPLSRLDSRYLANS